MGLWVRHRDARDANEVHRRFSEEGLTPRRWANPPGDTYGWHDHAYHKVLYCVRGAITFHGRDGQHVELRPGDRLDVEAGTEHAATVGPEGVECMEAPRPGRPERS